MIEMTPCIILLFSTVVMEMTHVITIQLKIIEN